jgi:hypothetical protein
MYLPSALGALSFCFASASSATCNLQGNWAAPPDGSGYQVQIVQSVGEANFTYFYSQAPGGLPGAIQGSNVSISGYDGVVATSPYPNFSTKSAAPACTLLTFNGNMFWCK